MENDIPELQPILNDINEIINPNIELLEQQEKETSNVKAHAKKPAPAPSKKDKSPIPSDITLPTSNIESIVFLIDNRFADLPFDALMPFNKIPYKSYDFSLNTYIMRLKALSFNQATSNSISVVGNVKYYLDYFLKYTKTRLWLF